MPDSPRTVYQLRDEQEREFGTYVATEVIFIDGARAANPGDPIPVGHVETLGLVDPRQVAKPSTKSGREALRALGLDFPEPSSESGGGGGGGSPRGTDSDAAAGGATPAK